MDDLEQILAPPIRLAEQVIKMSDEAHTSRKECMELKAKVERLAALLRQADRTNLYAPPARRIFGYAEKALDRALALVDKCRAHGLVRRVFTVIPQGSFKGIASQLDNSTGDLSWLLRVSAGSSAGDGDGDLPPITQNEPILFVIWEQIAVLYTGDLDARADAAAGLISLARDLDMFAKLIMEENGVPPLLKLLKEGQPEGQENAALAIGLLGRNPESVEQMVLAGVCYTFASVLKYAPIKVQAMVAWAVSELAANHPKCQDAFAQHNVIHLLAGHLAFDTDTVKELQDPETEAAYMMKANAAKALWQLAKGNAAICKSITESRALLCFALLLEKGEGDARHSSAMALMEICKVAEQNSDLRRSAFKPSSPAARAVVHQLVRVVDKDEQDDLLIPCVVSLGCLSRIFRETETRIIAPLVNLLDGREADVSREAALSLAKFACTENYLRADHSKAIVDAGGAMHLFQLVYFGEQALQLAALTLVCYIAHNVPDSEELAQVETLRMLEWASKQAYMMQDPTIWNLLPEAKIRLELHQSTKG